MSRAVIPDYEFNKKEFARLLSVAKGSRTQSDFAHDCGVSLSLISRFLNEKKETPPTPGTIYQIARAADGGVTSDALLRAGGYNPKKYAEPERKPSPSSNMNQGCFFTIASALARCEFEWSALPPHNLVVSNKNGQAAFDWGIVINDGEDLLDNWYYTFRMFPDNDLDLAFLQNIYGLYSMFSFDTNTKISIVVSRKKYFDFIKAFPPLSLSIYVSVILIDLNGEKIKEEYLSTALDLPDRLKTVYRLSNKGSVR